MIVASVLSQWAHADNEDIEETLQRSEEWCWSC